jgi:hypothetical protein
MGIKPRETVLLTEEVVDALNDLPILGRLEFAQNLLFSNGGNKDALRPQAALILIYQVIGDVIKVLDKHPAAAKLRTPEHKLG